MSNQQNKKWTPEGWASGWGEGVTGPNAAITVWIEGHGKIQIIRKGRKLIAIIPCEEFDGEDNAERIVACVNACAGMGDPAAEIAQLRQQRDELEIALKHIVFTVRDQKCSISEFEAQQVVVNTAEAALAKIK